MEKAKQRYAPSPDRAGTWIPDDNGNWVESDDNPGYMEKTIHSGNVHARIFRPILDEHRRDLIEAEVKSMLAMIGRERMRIEAEKAGSPA